MGSKHGDGSGVGRDARADEDPLAEEHRTTSVAFSSVLATSVLLLVFFAVGSCAFMLHKRERMPQLRVVRAALAIAILLWACGALASDVAFWRIVDALGIPHCHGLFYC